MWEAAALGLLGELQRYLDEDDPTLDDVTRSCWGACHGNQPETARLLLSRGADINWIGYDGLTPLDAAERTKGSGIVAWLRINGAVSARTAQ